MFPKEGLLKMYGSYTTAEAILEGLRRGRLLSWV